MYFNIHDVENKKFESDYFDVEGYDYKAKENKVKEMVENMKKKVNELFTIFENIFIGKLQSHSKEFKLKNLQVMVDRLYTKFTGKEVCIC